MHFVPTFYFIPAFIFEICFEICLHTVQFEITAMNDFLNVFVLHYT